jgi:PAS domain S-box-containing protein
VARSKREGLCRYALLLAFCLSANLHPVAETNPPDRAERQQTEVLFLSAFDPDLPDIDPLIEETETQVLEGRNTPVHFSLEYLDLLSASAGESYRKNVLAFLREKYRGHSFDLVITIGEPTLQFAEENRARLFPDAALLFVMARPENAENILTGKLPVTGVIRTLNYLPTLELALRQSPGTHSVIVVCGSSDFEKLEIKVAHEQFRSYESTVDFQYWTGLTFKQLDSRLANLNPDSLVLFLNFLSDSANRQYTPSRILRTVSRTANRPIYGTFASFVGAGIVGGSVADLRQAGRALGQEGARILNGEKPENIPVATGEFQRYMFDWRQLHRWGISEDQLPPGSSVLFWESSSWEVYRWRIIGLALLVIVQALLIALLLTSRARRRRAERALLQKEEERRRAEEELKQSEEKFSKAFRRGPLAVALTSAETHRYIDVNDTFEEFSGFRREELVGRCALELGIWVDPTERLRITKQLLAEGHLRDLEVQYRRKSGDLRVALASAELIEIEGKPCMLAVIADITDRKRAQEALLESEKRFRLMADSAPVLMWISGPDKLCTDFNQEWLRFTGRTMPEELGEGWTHDVHPEDLPACLEIYVRAFDARQSFAMEYRLRRHDGEYRWVLDRGVPRFLENGGFAGYIGCCIDITDEKQAKAARAELSGRLIQAQEEERARIARELHDDINQRLALLANGLEELQHAPAEELGTSLNQELQKLWQVTSEIATDIQQLSHQLHPAKLHYLGLAAAARELCREFSRQHKIAVECVVRNLPADLDETVRLSLFRTIQESLRNVAKHSQAHQVRVELTRESGRVRLHVSDDGVGFDPERAIHGLGLVSMRERLRLVGGQFSIRSRPLLGTRIEATVPANAKSVRAA